MQQQHRPIYRPLPKYLHVSACYLPKLDLRRLPRNDARARP